MQIIVVTVRNVFAGDYAVIMADSTINQAIG